MATADDYAEWIVNNADKKGTSDFDTVAAAYKEALAEEKAAVKAEAKPAPAPKKAAPVEGAYGFMGEGIEDTTDVNTDVSRSVMAGVKAAPVGTPSKAPFKPEVRAAIESKYNTATPQDRKKLATVPGATGDVFRQQAQEDERAKNLPEATQRLNPRAEFDATRVVEPSDTAESVKGVKSGTIGLKSTWEGLGASKDVGVALNRAKAIDLYNQIDSGALDKSNLTPDVAGGDMSPVFRDAAVYLNSNESKRTELRNRAISEIQNRKDFVAAAIKTIQQYQEENKVNKGRTENLTDIKGAADFSDWLAFNLGSGAVQLAPIMIAAATTGVGGVFATGVGMELGGQTQNRIDFILNKTKNEKDPKAKADAVFDYVQKTGDLNLATAIAAGAIDMALGPAARLAKEPLRQVVREKTRIEIAKAAAKAIPGDMLEEGVAGGLQESISIAAERILEEQGGDAFSVKNIKRVVDALAAEAVAGGGAGAGAGVVKTIKGPTAPVVPEPLVGTTTEETSAMPGRRPTLGRLEAANNTALQVDEVGAPPLSKLEGARDESIELETPPVTPPAEVIADPRMDTLVQSYRDQGYMEDDAQRLAQMSLSALNPSASSQGRVLQRDNPEDEAQTVEDRANRAAIQAEGQNDTLTEPPSYVTQPDSDQFGTGLSSTSDGGGAGVSDNAFSRGYSTAEDFTRSANDGEERERTALEEYQQEQARTELSEHYKRVESTLARAFNLQAFPNLSNVFGADWMRQTMASNPTPEEFQDAAYAKLEELSALEQRAFTGGYSPTTETTVAEEPVVEEPIVEEPIEEESRPLTLEERATVRASLVKSLDEQGLTEEEKAGFLQRFDERTQKQQEEPSVTETTETEQTKEEGQEEPAADEPTSEFEPLELEAGRNEALELSGEELDAYNAMVQSRAELARVEQSHEKAAKTRAPGGGRKPSENKRTETERNEQSKAINQYYRDVMTLLGFADKASQRQAIEAFSSVDEWQEKEDKRAQSLEALQRVIYRESLKYGTTKAHVALKDYVRSMPEAQLAKAKAATLADTGKAKKSKVSIPKQEHSTEVNPEFKQFSSLLGALSYIGLSGNYADKSLVQVLLDEKNRRFTRDVTFMVVEQDDPSIPDDVKELLSDSKGAYAPFKDKEGGIIYIAGESFGHTGMDNLTVLHEAVHAITTLKLIYVEDAIEAGETSDVDPELAQAYKELQNLMQSAYESLVTYKGPLQERLDELLEFGAFEDTHEFLTYGLTDPTMKEFLSKVVPGTSTKTSGFDKLVDLIMKALGVDPSMKTALKDLILISNQIMDTKVSAETMREMAEKADAEANDVIKAMRKSDAEIEAEYAKLKDSKNSKQKLNILGNISKIARDPTELGRLLVAKWNRLSVKDLRENGFLKLLPTDELIKRGTELGVGSLDAITDNINKLAAFRIKTLRQIDNIKNDWVKLKSQDAANLADVMHFTTLVGIDPTTDKSSKRVNDEWDKLSDKAKAVYVAVRNWYANNYKLYGQYLQERVDAVAGSAEEKSTLMAAIRTVLEAGSKLAPYFPLMRYGQYWARVGKGEKAIFAMFEDSDSRDAFVREKMAELAAKGDTRSRERLFEDNMVDEGNSLEELKNKLPEHNETVKGLFESIDNMTSVDSDSKNALKQEVFQMHLNTMPDQSFRKQFLHRQGRAGFSNDALRNFVTLGTKLTTQLGRIKYGPKLTNAISAARSSLKGNPDKAKLGLIVDRIEARVDEEIAPTVEDSSAVQLLTKTAYLWQMSAVKSGVTQMFSLVTHGLPVLWKHHGIGRSTTQALFDTASIGFGLVGKLKPTPNGGLKYEFPSLKNSLGKGNPLLAKAHQAFEDSELGEMTRTADIMARTKVPTSEYSSVGKKIENALTFFVHAGERMSREIMFMASVKLNYGKLKKDNKLTEAEKIEKAINNAMAETREALFDYSKFNTPEAMRPVALQTVLQYRKFQVFSTVYLLRNANEMLSNLPAAQRVDAAKALFGTMGMTAIIAGVPGTFMYSAVMALIQGAINALHDDDKEMPLELLNFKKYFENVWLRKKFGDTMGEVLAHGALDAVTGYEIGKNVSQDFWFHDGPDAPNWKEAWARVIAEGVGPVGGMVSNWMNAIDEYNKGHTLKAWENLVPALFRGIVTDLRYAKEGVRGMFGDIIKSKSQFTDFQYFMQSLGYKTAPLAQKLADNFAIKQIVQKVENKRKSLMSKLLDADEIGTMKQFNKVLDDIDKFNAMYPDREIEDENIDAAFEHREKMLEDTERGLYLPEEYDRLERLTRGSNKALRKESAQ